MKCKTQKRKLASYAASRGVERKQALERGDVWIKPVMYMEMKTKYNRCHQKQEVYRELKG